jgi:non-ribosomal peptide synthetase component F
VADTWQKKKPEIVSPRGVSMMVRTDIHLGPMLRHLGAVYYDSRHGRATRTDVAPALDTVEDHLTERAQRHPAWPAVAGEPILQHTAAQVTGGHGGSPH